jgi:hypothetical protein
MYVLGLAFVNRRAIVAGQRDHQASGLDSDASVGGGRYDAVRRMPAGNRGGHPGRRLPFSRRDSITSCGQSGLPAKDRSHLMGALETLNGSVLFWLTTAFQFAAIQKVWLVDRAERER